MVVLVVVGHEWEVAAAVAAAARRAAAFAVSVTSVPRRWASPLRLEGTVEPDFPFAIAAADWRVGKRRRELPRGGVGY